MVQKECKKCTGSGGECGSVDGNFQCFCMDGPHSASCKGIYACYLLDFSDYCASFHF